jgi:hypothetical protein
MGAQVEEDRLGTPPANSRRSGVNKAATASRRAPVRVSAQDEHDERDQDRDDVVDERGEMSDDERVELFRDSIMQSVLPDLPTQPGYHNAWLSTANARDPISRRLMMGYELIQVSEMPPDWQGASLKTGDYQGYVGINEMVAARIPTRLYKRYMHVAHEEQPLQEEEKLKAQTQTIKDGAARHGMRIVEEGDGTADVIQRAGRPAEFPA